MNDSVRKGFTLIELIIAVAVVGLLSLLVMIAVNNARQKPRNAKRLADVQQMQRSLELYYNDNGSYPTVATPVVLGSAGYTALCGSGGFSSACAGTPYLSFIPEAPLPPDGNCTDAVGSNPYTYVSGSTNGISRSYSITFCLGLAVSDFAPGLHTASNAGIQ